MSDDDLPDDDVPGDYRPNDPNKPLPIDRKPLPKRFYAAAAALPVEGGHALALDGRTARTPAKRPFVLPDADIAAIVVAEWEAQATVIDPATMPATRIANAVIDGVIARADEVAADLVRYAGTDLVCYRADRPESLVALQARHWDPVLAFAREKLGARFILVEGVMAVDQPDHALKAVAAALPSDPWALGALHVATSIGGSALIALALAHGALTAEQAYRAAFVDEDFQISQWGEDDEAIARRIALKASFDAAAAILAARRHAGSVVRGA